MHRRVYIFLDESGDLGLSPRSSKHLVIAAVATTEPMVRRLLENRVESDVTSHHAGLFPSAVRVGHQDSANSEGLQVADHVAGAVFQGLERGDGSYLDIIADKVVHGEVYW